MRALVMLAGSLLAIASECSEHTITVLVPVKELSQRTHVEAAVVPGRVLEFEGWAHAYPNGVVVRDGKVVANLDSDDLVAVRAGDGDAFGSRVVKCRQNDGHSAALFLGAILVVASVVGGVACSVRGLWGNFDR
jgi:glyoxylate utilization-related uncharacterized protein